MKNAISRIIVPGSAFVAPIALAHPGHDHSHWLSDPIHVLSALAVASIIAVGAIVIKSKISKNKADIKAINKDQ